MRATGRIRISPATVIRAAAAAGGSRRIRISPATVIRAAAAAGGSRRIRISPAAVIRAAAVAGGSRRIRISAAGAVICAAAAACGSGGAAAVAPTSGSTTAAASGQQQGQVPAGPVANPVNGPARATGLLMSMPSRLGPVVTDDYMLTLYRFDGDSPKPSRTTCTDACARQWPPVLVGANLSVDASIDQKLVGTLKRPDGTTQVTLAGWPLYRFAGEAAEGTLNGEGVNGTWFAAAPDGSKAGGGKKK
jgi:predicted lipoprotein with Yx(FWY)xxD motif